MLFELKRVIVSGITYIFKVFPSIYKNELIDKYNLDTVLLGFVIDRNENCQITFASQYIFEYNRY